MKVNDGDVALPPLVDVEQPSNRSYWVSPALPCLPVRDKRVDGRFEAFALTALVVETQARRKFDLFYVAGSGRKRVELRLVRVGMTLKASGVAVPDDPHEGGLHQTLAYGTVPLDTFIKRVIPPLGRSITNYDVMFYENDVDLASSTVGGTNPFEPAISVKIARGIDAMYKNAIPHGSTDTSIMFVFSEGAKSLKKFARDVRKQNELEMPKYVVRCPMCLDGQCKFVFGYAKRITPHGLGKDVLTENLSEAVTFGSRDAAEKAARKLLGKTYHEMNVVCVDDIPKEDRK